MSKKYSILGLLLTILEFGERYKWTLNNILLIQKVNKYLYNPIITKFINAYNIKSDILLINPVARRRLNCLISMSLITGSRSFMVI